MKNIILDLCGGTGSWSDPWKEEYDVRVITLPEYDVTDAYFLEHQMVFRSQTGLDDLHVAYGDVYGIFAAPPCTMFSRARTTAKTPRDFKGAMEAVRGCLEVIWQCEFHNQLGLGFWAIENPAGHLKRFLGNPAFKFHPYDFGDRHSKETYIWGRFIAPKKRPVVLNETEIMQSRNNTRPLPKIPDGYVRDGKMRPVQIRRSITPQGFARAFYKSNH